MFYRSSDCILKQKAWKNIFSASWRKILGLRWKILASRWKILASRWKILASWWKILASRRKILGLCHTNRACFYVTQISQMTQIFFRTRIARKRRGYEPFSLSLAAIVSPMREVHRRLGGEKQGEIITQMKARRHGYITQITRISQIFLNTKRARLRAFFIEPCSHCQPDARSASKAGRRKARRDNITRTLLKVFFLFDFLEILSHHANRAPATYYVNQ